MSGTAAPDPRIARLAQWWDPEGEDEPFWQRDDSPEANWSRLLDKLDAADRAAGVIRVRTDDATVEKVAHQLHQQDAYEIHNDWDDLSDYRRDAFRDRARGILEALATPPPVG